ncbi:MAG TPA: hypothetical protein VN848_03140 [Gemmatimonadales bacterium]|nr:hypothetical protein [Gemmatimonadales bacterium]
MTSRSRYLSGLAGIGIVTLAVSSAFPPATRGPLLIALAVALVVQAPLGWWLTKSIGTTRFMLAWGAGLGARLLLVGAMGMLGVPLLRLAPSAVLVPLAGLLMALLAVEAVVVALALPQAKTR